MSAYKKIECSLADKKILFQALRDLGLDPKEHASPVTMRGSYGHERENLQAEIVVSQAKLAEAFGTAHHDVGFTLNSKTNNYDIVCYDYDANSGMANRIKQAYVVAAVQQALSSQRFSVKAVEGNMKQRARSAVKIVAAKVI